MYILRQKLPAVHNDRACFLKTDVHRYCSEQRVHVL